MSPQLPERASLEQLKKQAKSLLRAAHEHEPAARQRFRVLPAFAAMTSEQIGASDLALHDAQSVIAREHGFASWKELREEVEVRALSFDAAVDEFLRCATGGARRRAERLLARYPAIAHASLFTELVLGDATAADARLRDRPQLAAVPGGVQQWEPLLYVCHTCVHRDPEDLVAIARQLLAAGANANAEYHWNWHPELPRTALWGATCAVAHLPLAEALLAAGANPTDGVSMHIAGGGGNLAALELLYRYGADVDGVPGGVPPLVYILTWATDPAGPRWLLEHGADANRAWGDAGEAPLHVTARRWDVAMVELLVAHGANLSQRRADGETAHTLAELAGNHAIAEWLRAHGAADELTPLQRFVAACARGDRGTAESMLSAEPSLRTELRPDHHLLVHHAAETGNQAMLESMLACGFDANAADKDHVTPLHRAAMSGYPEAARLLLAYGADVNALDGMFAAPPLIWAVEGRSSTDPAGRDFVGVARVLIAHGSALEWTPPSGAPGPERTLEGLVDLRRDAAAAPA